jgi:hypothetical protein
MELLILWQKFYLLTNKKIQPQEKLGKKLIGPAVFVGGMVLLTADSLLGAPYVDYLTSLNSWICFWAIFLLRPIEKQDYTKSKHAVLR